METTMNVETHLINGVIANANSGIKVSVSRSPITLRRPPYQANFQKEGKLTAELSQVVTIVSEYPSRKVGNELNQSLVDIEEFGFTSQIFERKEERITWIDVPTHYTEEKVKTLLEAANANKAVIYKILSNEPILVADQVYSISIGQRTKDDFADSQVVRYGKDTVIDEVNVSGQLIKDPNGNIQYKRNNFWGSPKDDMDLRGKSAIYHSAKIRAELSGATVFEGQEL